MFGLADMGEGLKLTGPLGPQSEPTELLRLSAALVHLIANTVWSAQAVTMDPANSTSSNNESINMFTELPGVAGVVEAFLALRIGCGAR